MVGNGFGNGNPLWPCANKTIELKNKSPLHTFAVYGKDQNRD